MPIDPSIPLQFRPTTQMMSPADAISLKQMSQKLQMGEMAMQEERRKQAEGQELRRVFSRPDAIDPKTGLPTQQTLADIDKINPQTGMQTRQLIQKQISDRTTQELARLKVTEAQNNILQERLSGVIAGHEANSRMVGGDAANQSFGTLLSKAVDEIQAQAGLSPEAVARLRQATTVDEVIGMVGGSKQYRDMRAATKPDDAAPKMRTRIAGDQEIQEQWNPQTRAWDKLGSGPRFARQVAPVVNVGGGRGKPPSGYRFKEDGNLEPIPGGPADKGSGQALTADAIDLRASQYLAGDSRATANLGRGRQGAEDIIKITNRAAEMLREKGGNPQEIGRRIAEFRANSNSLTALTKSYDAVTAFEETAVRNGEILNDLARKVDTTGIPVVERWLRAGRKEIAGDSDVANFMAQLTLYRAEAAKILTNPNMAGVLSDSARKEIEEFLKPGASKEQIIGVTNLLKRDFKNRKETMEAQINSVRGRLERNLGPGEGAPKTDEPKPNRKPLSAFGS